MRSLMHYVVTAILTASLILPALASAATVGERQGKQQARINQGVRSGELTPGEAASLEKEQAKIQKAKMKAKRDGVVTAKEKDKLDTMQDKASKRIYTKKHNMKKAY